MAQVAVYCIIQYNLALIFYQNYHH